MKERNFIAWEVDFRSPGSKAKPSEFTLREGIDKPDMSYEQFLSFLGKVEDFEDEELRKMYNRYKMRGEMK